MDAARTLSALAATGLEGPSKVEEALVDTARVAEVIALGVSATDLDSRAQAAIDFYLERLYTTFVIPALATASREAFLELWDGQRWSAMRLMDAVFLTLHEANQVSSSELLTRRLEHSDREVINDSAQTIAERFDPGLGDELRDALALVELARRLFRGDSDELQAEVELIKMFHRGVLIWALGVHLSISIAERSSSLIKDDLRPDLAANSTELVGGGARMAGVWAAFIAGLELVDGPLSAAFQAQLQRTAFITFMLRASLEVRGVFGPDVRFGIAEFFYPDEPDAWELHLVIDSPADATVAGEALDRLCDTWWDAAAAELGVDFFPVLGGLALG